jgi:hypothetical protein
VSGTGWAWQHARHECDLPTYFALCKLWQDVPPPAVQLRRIAQYLGLVPKASPGAARMAPTTQPTTPSSQQEIAMAAGMAGMHAIDGRPADPMLSLLD